MKNIILSLIIIAGVILGGYFISNNNPNMMISGIIEPYIEGCYSLTTADGKKYVVSSKPADVEDGYYIEAKGYESEDPNICVTKIFIINDYKIIATSTGAVATTTNATINESKKSHMITLDTNYGTIVFETHDSDAPNTVKNFITLAEKGFYNNLTFHRVIPGFMIQGGDPNGNGSGGPGYQFADELNPNTASYKAGYKKGVVAMANAGPNTNGSQFFIMTADYPLPNNYTIFGKVVSGQDVVDKIANVPRGQNDKPVSPVTIKTITVN